MRTLQLLLLSFSIKFVHFNVTLSMYAVNVRNVCTILALMSQIVCNRTILD